MSDSRVFKLLNYPITHLLNRLPDSRIFRAFHERICVISSQINNIVLFSVVRAASRDETNLLI